jgi:probable rRNA maturation factor
MGRKSSAKPAQIEVQIAPEFSSDISESLLRAAAQKVLQAEGLQGQATVVLTDDTGTLELNREYLGIDSPTDVLAFSAQEGDEPFAVAPEAMEYLGDVVISYPRAQAQAARFGHSTQNELQLLVVHGMLHLLGYDHATDAEKVRMWDRQESILESLREPEP